jgi:hypothetical protein
MASNSTENTEDYLRDRNGVGLSDVLEPKQDSSEIKGYDGEV